MKLRTISIIAVIVLAAVFFIGGAAAADMVTLNANGKVGTYQENCPCNQCIKSLNQLGQCECLENFKEKGKRNYGECECNVTDTKIKLCNEDKNILTDEQPSPASGVIRYTQVLDTKKEKNIINAWLEGIARTLQNFSSQITLSA